MKAIKVILILSLFSLFARAQGAVGCYVPASGNFYPTKVPGQPNYSSKEVTFIGVACVPGGGAGTTSCFVNGGVGNGIEGEYSTTNCPIDEDVFYLIAAVSLIGFATIRKFSLVH